MEDVRAWVRQELERGREPDEIADQLFESGHDVKEAREIVQEVDEEYREQQAEEASFEDDDVEEDGDEGLVTPERVIASVKVTVFTMAIVVSFFFTSNLIDADGGIFALALMGILTTLDVIPEEYILTKYGGYTSIFTTAFPFIVCLLYLLYRFIEIVVLNQRFISMLYAAAM
jgi:hypothetical protein